MKTSEVKRAMELIEAIAKMRRETQMIMDPAPHWWEITRNNGDKLRLFSNDDDNYPIIRDAVVNVIDGKIKRWEAELADLGVEI